MGNIYMKPQLKLWKIVIQYRQSMQVGITILLNLISAVLHY